MCVCIFKGRLQLNRQINVSGQISLQMKLFKIYTSSIFEQDPIREERKMRTGMRENTIKFTNQGPTMET